MKFLKVSILVVASACVGQAGAVSLPMSTPYAVWSTLGLGSGVPLLVHSKRAIAWLTSQLNEAMEVGSSGDVRNSKRLSVSALKKQIKKYKALCGLAIVLITGGAVVGAGGALVGTAEYILRNSDNYIVNRRSVNAAPWTHRLFNLNFPSVLERGRVAEN